jgi:O-antigen/teichoic acid export membrane protein
MTPTVWIDAQRKALVEQWKTPVVRNGYALVASTVVTSILGGLYWVLAARNYTVEDVGVAAALISAQGFLTNLAAVVLTNLLNRFVPTAGRNARWLVCGAYLAGIVVTLIGCVVFVLGVRVWSPDLVDALNDGDFALWFIVSSACWVVFVNQDAVLAGLGEGPYVLFENFFYGIAKLVLLVALASSLPEQGVFLSWTLPLPLVVLAVNILVFGRLIPRHHAVTTEPLRRAVLARFIASDYLASLLWIATVGLMPIIVLQHSGADASAYVFTSWTIAYTLYLISRSMGMALTTAGAKEPQRLTILARRTLLENARIVVPVVVVLVAAAPWALALFGKDYATEADTMLRLFALSALPYIVTSTFLCVARVQRRMSAVIVVTTAMAALTLSLTFVFLYTVGPVGVGIAWLVAQTVVAIALLLTEFRSMWVAWIAMKRLEPLVAGARSLAGTSRSSQVMRRASALVSAEPTLGSQWRVSSLLASLHDVDLVELESRWNWERGVLRLARTETGARGLVRHADALRALRNRPELTEWNEIVPAIVAEGFETQKEKKAKPTPETKAEATQEPRSESTSRDEAEPESTNRIGWLVETKLTGWRAHDLATAARAPELIAATVDAMAPLYRGTAREITVDDALIEEWVDAPLRRLLRAHTLNGHRVNGALQEQADAMARVGAAMRDELIGRVIPCAFGHGDLWLGNVLVDPDEGTVTGIIDWDQSRDPDLPHIDIAHLVVANRAARSGLPMGRVVVRSLHDQDMWEPDELALLDGGGGFGECPVARRTLLLLAWLRHVSGLIDKSSRYTRSMVWRAQNTELVLERV